MKIGIFYGSTTGNTQKAAEKIGKAFSEHDVTIENIADVKMASLSDYDLIIFGTSTWGMGEMQNDWMGQIPFKGVDLSGKNVAIFGLGDQSGFCDTFVDAMGAIAQEVKNAGAILIGTWPTNEYTFCDSQAVVDGKFVGLALDEENQPEMTESRIAQWVDQLKQEL